VESQARARARARALARPRPGAWRCSAVPLSAAPPRKGRGAAETAERDGAAAARRSSACTAGCRRRWTRWTTSARWTACRRCAPRLRAMHPETCAPFAARVGRVVGPEHLHNQCKRAWVVVHWRLWPDPDLQAPRNMPLCGSRQQAGVRAQHRGVQTAMLCCCPKSAVPSADLVGLHTWERCAPCCMPDGGGWKVLGRHCRDRSVSYTTAPAGRQRAAAEQRPRGTRQSAYPSGRRGEGDARTACGARRCRTRARCVTCCGLTRTTAAAGASRRAAQATRSGRTSRSSSTTPMG